MLRQAAEAVYYRILDASPHFWQARVSYLLAHGRLPNLTAPRRLTEHLFVQKLRGHEAFAALSDKVRVKDFVARTIGPTFVTPTLWHGPALPPREERTWPLPFVLKTNHGSGMNAMVRDATARDWPALEAEVERWLRTSWPRWLIEDWYNTIERQVLVEPLLNDGTGGLPDYKVLVFFGQARIVQVDTDRFTSRHARAYYDRDCNREPFWVGLPLPADPHPRPARLPEMLRAAEALGAGFDFVRVDFYDLPDGLRFSELTFSPGAGLHAIKPHGADLALGRLWEECRAASGRGPG